MKNSFAGKNDFPLLGCFSNLLQNFCAQREKMTAKNDSERLVLGLVLGLGRVPKNHLKNRSGRLVPGLVPVWCRDVNKYFPAPLQHPCGMDTTNQKTV
jgi:hypothetical protein